MKFFNKRERKKCSKNNRIIGLALNASDKRKENRRVRGTTLGMEGKATAETRGRRVATNGADSGEPPAKGSWGYKAASTRG